MHYEPIIINDLCAIHAPHHENIPSVRYDIIINPRMAFGSGTHETTSMLTEILLNKDLKGKKTLDMGCGTGILAIAMSLSGAENVYAIDIDEKSVANTTENISLNNINNIETILGDASAISKIGKPLNLIVANIHKNIIINDMHLYANALTPKGELIVSGFYTEDANDILTSAKEYGLSLKQTYSKNNWCVLLLQAT
jgi:ribosomal protein L11 methyltransferase